jgi:hypothetical protein
MDNLDNTESYDLVDETKLHELNLWWRWDWLHGSNRTIYKWTWSHAWNHMNKLEPSSHGWNCIASYINDMDEIGPHGWNLIYK